MKQETLGYINPGFLVFMALTNKVNFDFGN